VVGYYVLYDTGNNQFFLDTMTTLCSTYVENLIDLYSAYGTWPDMTRIKQHIEINKDRYDPFNCAMVPFAAAKCPDRRCRARHTPVLATDQVAEMGNVMNDLKRPLILASFKQKKDKAQLLRLQSFIEHYATPTAFDMEELKVGRGDPLTYLDRYIEAADDQLPHADNYRYIRSAADSDFQEFANRTKLQSVQPCDAFQ